MYIVLYIHTYIYIMCMYVYEKSRLYWCSCSGKVANGGITVLERASELLRHMSDAWSTDWSENVPSWEDFIHQGHWEASRRRHTELQMALAVLVSVAEQWGKELPCQKKKSSEKTSLFRLREVDNSTVTKESFSFDNGFQCVNLNVKVYCFISNHFYNLLFKKDTY